jgi:hypothetical protein
MERVKCLNSSSGNIASYGWQAEGCHNNCGTLEVEFVNKKGPAVYQYDHVPQNLWQGLLQAPSAGNFLNSQVKPGYPARRVQD